MVLQHRQSFLTGAAMERTPSALACNKKINNITRTLILASMLIFALPLVARESTDVIVMKNGDRLTCKIKQLEAGVLTVGLDYVDGDLSIDWKKVSRVESNQLFIVKTQDGSVFMGKLKTVAKMDADRPAELEIVERAEGEKQPLVEMTRVVNVRQTSEDSLKKWSADITTGTTYSKGNNAAQYNIGFQALYRRERWAAQTNLSSNLAANSGARTSNRNLLTLNAYHLLPWANYFYGGIGSFLQSSVQGIRLQTSLGAGIGRFLKDTNRTQIALMGGLAWQSTNYHQNDVPQPVQNVAAGLIAMELNLFRFSKTKLNISAQLFPALSEPGRLHVNTNASYFVKLVGNVSWTMTFYGSWDTEPPPRFSTSDYGTTSGLSWSFGR
jgi:Protein of unknown function, DUF481